MKINYSDIDDNCIRQSSKGNYYAPPQRLDQKKKVYSLALLQRIPHETEGKIDICLKIGRYNILGGVETENPKSELTLTSIELKELIAYLEKYYKPLELEMGQFLPIENGDTKQLLLQFKSIVKTDDEAAKQILDSGLLSNNVYIAIDLIRKKEALEKFEKALLENELESFWQEWFEKNKWVLGSEYLKIIDERKIDTEHIADYLMEAFDGFLDIVEIKKPNGLKFWADAKDHNNFVPSSDLIKAITQCQNYLYEIERESNSVKFLERTDNTKVIKPRGVLVYGRSNEWGKDQKEAFRILNASLNQITVLTYDHILLRAKNVLGIDTKEDDFPF